MKFETYFTFTSYAVVACGALALLASGGISFFVAAVFAVALCAAWRFEETKWQFSERLGLVLIVLALPLFYLDWQYQIAILARERAGAATLAHLILGLSVLKLFQVKGDRDWVFIYLISFFEVLLAAGLSISPSFLATLVLYLLFAVCTIIAFEMRKAARNVKIVEIETPENPKKRNLMWRLPVTAAAILLLISLFAAPTFFMMPRVGGAGIGGGGGRNGLGVGFSDSVNLGAIGTLQQSNEVVMRVRIENAGASNGGNLRWRGSALDFFDNRGWRNTRKGESKTVVSERGLFKFGEVERLENLTVQTVYLEPIDTPVLFGATRIVGVEGGFPALRRDDNGAITLPLSGNRSIYKVYSDTVPPDAKQLRADRRAYPQESQIYLRLPEIDSRISALAGQIIQNSGAQNRYDAARAIENYLQTQFGYTLEMKAGGAEPVADFLFNIREGHCEYFATSMAVMLRTQGIATRIVNGFQSGEYNNAADVFVVTQKDAHSWVEVYFPETDSWVTFDPTPAAGRDLSAKENAANFLTSQIGKYAEAFNMFWLQYVVAYDNQEQRSLARSFRETLVNTQNQTESYISKAGKQLKEWWQNISGERGTTQSFLTIAQTVLLISAIAAFAALLWILGKRIAWRNLFQFRRGTGSQQVVKFYERMTRALAKQGLKREQSQTPLEFAAAVGASEALQITEAYNRVRFGKAELTRNESTEIENWLRDLERVK